MSLTIHDLMRELLLAVYKEHGARITDVTVVWDNYTTISEEKMVVGSIEITMLAP